MGGVFLPSSWVILESLGAVEMPAPYPRGLCQPHSPTVLLGFTQLCSLHHLFTFCMLSFFFSSFLFSLVAFYNKRTERPQILPDPTAFIAPCALDARWELDAQIFSDPTDGTNLEWGKA